MSVAANMQPHITDRAMLTQPRMTPTLAIPSPVCIPLLAAISLRALLPVMIATMAPMSGMTTNEAMPAIRLTIAIVLLCGPAGGICGGTYGG